MEDVVYIGKIEIYPPESVNKGKKFASHGHIVSSPWRIPGLYSSPCITVSTEFSSIVIRLNYNQLPLAPQEKDSPIF